MPPLQMNKKESIFDALRSSRGQSSLGSLGLPQSRPTVRPAAPAAQPLQVQPSSTQPRVDLSALNRPKTFQDRVDDVLDVTLRPITRFGARIAASITGKEGTPTTDLERFLFGDEPIRTVENAFRHGVSTAGNIATGGQNTELGKDIPDWAALPAGLLLGTLDATPVGGAKKKVAEKAASSVAANPLPKVTSKVDTPKPTVTLKGTDEISGPTTTVKLNTNRLDLPKQAKTHLDRETTEVIKRLSNDDVARLAKSAGLDLKTNSIAQTRKIIARQLNVRRDAVRLQNAAREARLKGDLDAAARLLKESAERGRTSRAQGTDIARQLQARRIIADELDTPQQKIFKLLDNAGVNPDVYAKRFANVDFDDARQVMQAYRELVPAKAWDWIDAVRYNSMLSSPLTHAVNTFSNALNVGVVAPVEKTVRGVIDAAGGLFGKERKFAAGEGLAYASASVKAIREAADNFVDVMRGKAGTQTADIDDYSMPLATGGAKGAVGATLQFPTRLLGAADKFFRTLARSGEENALRVREAKGIKIKGDRKALAEHEAAYRVYQQELGEKGQGKILETIDSVANAITGLRARNRVFGWVFPFIKTPTNLLKQGIEYSPLGFANLAGNADKTTALTRAAIGTAVFGTAAAMVDSGDITWAEPTNPEERAAFRAEGKQPYAIRVGDTWISFVKLPPAISFPFALTSAVNDAVKSKAIDENTADAIFEGVAKWGQFLSDQSYVKNIGDFLKTVKGDTESFTQAIANYPQQLIPFRALTGWLARMTDPLDRKINTDRGFIDEQIQALMLQYPGLRQNVDARVNPFTDQPLEANNPALNAFSPLRITNDKGFGDTTGYNIEERMFQGSLAPNEQKAFRQDLVATKNLEAQKRKAQEQFRKDTSGNITELPTGEHYAKVGNEYRTFDSREDAELAIAKHEFEKSDEKKRIVGDVYLYKTKDGDVRTKPKALYEWEQDDAKLNLEMDRAYEAGNLNAWLAAADKKHQALERKKGLFDPETEQDEIDKITLAQENLLQKAQGYIEKGGIGRGSGGGKKSVGSPYKYAVSLSAGGSAARPRVTVRGSRPRVTARSSATSRPKVTLKRSAV